jgi:glycosyltransferase involved in cell wall biosynthesis
MWVSDYRCSRESFGRLEALSRQWQPDVIQIEYPVMVQYLRAIRAPVARVLTDHDPAYAAADVRARNAPLRARAVLRLDAVAWRHAERNAIRSVNATVTFTVDDRDALRALAPGSRVEVIPLTVPVPAHPLDPNGRDDTILFVGNLVHPSNADAVTWLVRDIFPLIRAAVPTARLVLIGEDPRDLLRGVAKGMPGVEARGLVPDPTEYLDRAAVIVAPIRTGGGMRVKVLEAMAAGKAVVATPRGAAGLSVNAARELVLATSAQEVAKATIALLRDPDARRSLAGRARRAAERERSTGGRAPAYMALYADLAERLEALRDPSSSRHQPTR